MAIAGLSNLCTPAYVYLVVSLATVMVMFLQNFGSSTVYCLGMYECSVGSVGLIFFIKMLYILFWTWVLNLLCRSGAEQFSWFLVLIPYLIFFILLITLVTKI
jgi:hypothetical protein|uniref:Uncharacterized protein n=1 Tax=viral metagenome TaxID=1070528 RepID=A0A6C0IP77_9ZZZZ